MNRLTVFLLLSLLKADNMLVEDLLKLSIEAYKDENESDNISLYEYKDKIYSNYDLLHYSKFEYTQISHSLIYSHGYNKNGLRAKVFRMGNKIVIAVKGTTLYFHGIGLGPTGHKDREMDNLMFGRCQEEDGACEYQKKIKIDQLRYFKELEILIRTVLGVFKGLEIILTGHSLGGALSSLMSLKLSLPAIVFSSPGDKYIANVLRFSQIRETVSNDKLITHIGICEDTLFVGGCKSLCSLMGYTIDTACHLGRTLCVGLGDTPSQFVDNDRLIYHRAEALLDVLVKGRSKYYEIDCNGW